MKIPGTLDLARLTSRAGGKRPLPRAVPSAVAAFLLLCAAPALAQIPGLPGQSGRKALDLADSLTFTDEEEAELGRQLSALLRQRYGVVQDADVHRYVALTGTALALRSSRPALPWTFIVLDTDGVNAFAAPGGFVHVTRGALALLENEAQLAGVLGHEIGHVTARHTLEAIRKAKGAELAANRSRQAMIKQAAQAGYGILLENAWSRGDEIEADATAASLASTVGYAPDGLAAFLLSLSERYEGIKERSGLFASHPDITRRVEELNGRVEVEKLAGAATVEGRYRERIDYAPVPVTSLASAEPAAPQPQRRRGGLLGGLRDRLGSITGSDNSGTSTIMADGSRGVNPDRDAKGGPDSRIVAISVTADEVEVFLREVNGA
jgi:predicted Zn-dependent protease